DVGLGLPSSGQHLAELPGHRRKGDRRPYPRQEEGHPPRQCRCPVWLGLTDKPLSRSKNMDYWHRTITRRRALIASGGAGAAAALLAACGSGSSSSKAPAAPKDASGLLSQAVDTTKQIKRGGVLKLAVSSDVPSLDVQQNYTGNDFFFDAASR